MHDKNCDFVQKRAQCAKSNKSKKKKDDNFEKLILTKIYISDCRQKCLLSSLVINQLDVQFFILF